MIKAEIEEMAFRRLIIQKVEIHYSSWRQVIYQSQICYMSIRKWILKKSLNKMHLNKDK